MTAYRAIADSEVAEDAPVTALLVAALRNNALAIQQGDSTAPKISTANALDVPPLGVADTIQSGWPATPNATGGPIFISAQVTTDGSGGMSFVVAGNTVATAPASATSHFTYIVKVGEAFAITGTGTVSLRFHRAA